MQLVDEWVSRHFADVRETRVPGQLVDVQCHPLSERLESQHARRHALVQEILLAGVDIVGRLNGQRVDMAVKLAELVEERAMYDLEQSVVQVRRLEIRQLEQLESMEVCWWAKMAVVEKMPLFAVVGWQGYSRLKGYGRGALQTV